MVLKRPRTSFKYDYKVNMNIIVGTLRERFREIMLSTGKEFCEEIKKYLVPIKLSRTFQRKKNA